MLETGYTRQSHYFSALVKDGVYWQDLLKLEHMGYFRKFKMQWKKFYPIIVTKLV